MTIVYTMRVALFSLTGFANAILPALDGIGITPTVFVTRSEPGPFPHYPLPNALLIAEQLSTPWGTKPEDEERACGADLLLGSKLINYSALTIRS